MESTSIRAWHFRSAWAWRVLHFPPRQGVVEGGEQAVPLTVAPLRDRASLMDLNLTLDALPWDPGETAQGKDPRLKRHAQRGLKPQVGEGTGPQGVLEGAGWGIRVEGR